MPRKSTTQAVNQSSDEMRIVLLPLSEIKRWPRNPKKHKDSEIEASFSRFGMTQPLLRDEKTGRLVAGHGRLEKLLDLKERGANPPERVKVDKKGEWLIPVITGVSFSSEKEAEAYLLADNRISEVGGWEEEELFRMLHDQVGEGVSGLRGTAFGDEDYLSLLATFSQEGISTEEQIEEEFAGEDEIVEELKERANQQKRVPKDIKTWNAADLGLRAIFTFSAPIEYQGKIREVLEREFPDVEFAEATITTAQEAKEVERAQEHYSNGRDQEDATASRS